MKKHTASKIHGVDVLVTFDYYPSRRGSRDSLGVPIEPDEFEDLDILTVETFSGDDITDLMSDRVMDELKQRILRREDD